MRSPGLPIEAHGEGGDAFGGIFDEGDLAGVGVDQAGGGGAEPVVDGEPLVVVEAAVMEAIVGEVLEGVGATAVAAARRPRGSNRSGCRRTGNWSA